MVTKMIMIVIKWSFSALKPWQDNRQNGTLTKDHFKFHINIEIKDSD